MKPLYWVVGAAVLLCSSVGVWSLQRDGSAKEGPWREQFATPPRVPTLLPDAPAWVMPAWDRIQAISRGDRLDRAGLDELLGFIVAGRQVLVDRDPITPMNDDAYRMWLSARAAGGLTNRFIYGAPIDDPRSVVREFGRLLVEGLKHQRAEERKQSMMQLVESAIGALPEFRDELSKAVLDPDQEVATLARLKITQLNQSLDSARARGVLPDKVLNVILLPRP